MTTPSPRIGYSINHLKAVNRVKGQFQASGNCFSMQVEMNKCFLLLYPEKKLAVNRLKRSKGPFQASGN